MDTGSLDFAIQMAGRLLLASFLGGVIGLERELHGRPAGFRTHLLVSLGAALFVVTSIYFRVGFTSGGGPGADPARVAAQVVTGIGFLGAGAIIREGSAIRGLTTAACLWLAAAVGMASAAGLCYLSIFVTLIALGSLLLLKRVETLFERDKYTIIEILTDDMPGQKERISHVLQKWGMELLSVGVERDGVGRTLQLEIDVRYSRSISVTTLIHELSAIEGVRRVKLARVPFSTPDRTG